MGLEQQKITDPNPEALPEKFKTTRRIYEIVKALSNTQRKKRWSKFFADDFKINERRPVDQDKRSELQFWEDMRDLFHNYGITDYGAPSDDFIVKELENKK